jgi:hypothetical protein
MRINHDKELDDMARSVQNINANKKRFYSRVEYLTLTILFLCIFILDTQTWTQRALIVIITLAAGGVMWFYSKKPQVNDQSGHNSRQRGWKDKDPL